MSDKTSDRESKVPSKEPSTSDPEKYDETLDVFSRKFDPLKALYSKQKIKLPVPGALKKKSLNQLPTLDALIAPQGSVSDIVNASAGQPSNPFGEANNKRRFLPHQAPIQSHKTFKARNVITRIDEFKTGPLSRLRNFKEEKIRVKIITRHGFGVRGYCEAYIEAFDKHWNLALDDVTEVWTRKKHNKCPPIVGLETKPHIRKFHIPEVKVLKKSKKTELCQRKCSKLLLRGENVVSIHCKKEN